MGKLYLVSTPIGNLEDITLRAIRILGEADIILAEDTRTSAKLLKHYGISQKVLISFFEGNEERRILEVQQHLLAGKNVALVSESGTPLISDPGFKLVREAIRVGVPVESVPGPSAAIAALTISGLPPNAFTFLGFLPKKEGKARQLLTSVRDTVILYESPHRLLKTLYLIKELFGDTPVVVARELTKLHEEVRREKVSQAIVHFNEVAPRGEFVILFSRQEDSPRHRAGNSQAQQL